MRTGKEMISVIVPVYNGEKYLRACLDSLLRQTYEDLEILCVNDGSTDGSAEILREYEEKDPRVRVITQENAGPAAARTAGISAARGELIAFADDDDETDPSMYRVLADLMRETGAEIVHCGYERVHTDGSSEKVRGTEKKTVQNAEQAVGCLVRGELFTGSLCTKLFRRELFEGIRPDPTLRYNEDVLLNVQLFWKAKKSVFYDVCLYRYFEREGSATTAHDPLPRSRGVAAAGEKILELLSGTALEADAKRRLHYNYTCLYRDLLFDKENGHAEEMRNLRKKISALRAGGLSLSGKRRLDAFLLTRMPGFYKAFYGLYDRVRKKNMDV